MPTAATDVQPLSADLSQRILSRFGMIDDPPASLEALQQIVGGYTRTIPWESASRIARRARHDESADCVLLGDAFWQSHFEFGIGGTCYESNYAFFALLLRLGYDGYLTINDMGESIGCHSAIIIMLEGRKYLVDVGLPIYAVIPLDPMQETSAGSPFLHYRAEPLGADRYSIMREPHPRSQAFNLNDEPVSDEDYRAIAIHDYRHDGGQFLTEIVINKVVDEQLWRFNSDERPLRLQQFVDGARTDRPLGEDAAGEVAGRFSIARDVVAEAMGILGL